MAHLYRIVAIPQLHSGGGLLLHRHNPPLTRREVVYLRSGDHTGCRKALGLVVNMIVLWNTIYTEAALEQLRKEGFDVRYEDVARLSPLIYYHINMLGATPSSCRISSLKEGSGPYEIRRTEMLKRAVRPIVPKTRVATLFLSFPSNWGLLENLNRHPYVGFLFRCYSGPR